MRLAVFVLAGIIAALDAFAAAPASVPAPVEKFVGKYCVECHDADTKKGGLDLTTLPLTLQNPANFSSWVGIHDRAASGEMPPAKKARPAAADLKAFTNYLSGALLATDRAKVAEEGRATKRRLNRFEYEETLRDLLSLPYLEVRDFLPEDSESHLFNKVGDALDVSHVQMARYLNAAEFALRQAIAPQVEKPEAKTNRFYTMEERAFFGAITLEGPLVRRSFPLEGTTLLTNIMAQKPPQMPHTKEPAKRDLEAMAVVVSTYEPTEIRFQSFRAPVAGRYRLVFSGYSIQMAADYKSASKSRHSEPVTIYAETPPRSLRKLGTFDVGPEPTVNVIDAYLLAGETIRPDAARLHRSRPPDHKNPDAGPDGMPGVAFQWMESQGPLFDEWPPAGHKLLFGDLPLEQEDAKRPEGEGRRFRQAPKAYKVSAVSKDPERDAEKSIRAFMTRAYRRPVEEVDVQRFAGIVRATMTKGHSFTEAMIAAYTGVLSSPGFLYFQDAPGRLNDLALAERLSYFLWNSAPDPELRELAIKGQLHKPKTLRAQTERLLNDSRSRQFINAFLNYWLDLRTIAGSAPDEELYPDYQLDDYLSESMIDETQLYFTELLKRNLGVTNLVTSDFAMLNERMAKHYGIQGVEGAQFRRVSLPAESVRGGLLTEASVLKVTANGTTTSPVKRGAWIMTRLVGKPPPPPPASVPAVEPDIRGATTIREQLAKHRNQETCNACHRNIDPAGFALESFDVMGAWRERYRSVGGDEKVKGVGHNGNNFHFSLGPNVDASGQMPDGRKFEDVRQLKQCLASDPQQLARNMIQQLTVYATGAPMRFSDRPVVAKMLADTRANGYGLRDLVHELVQSELFLNK